MSKICSTSFFTPVGVVQAVRGIDIELKAGQTMGLVGESGCGKSVMSLSILGWFRIPAGLRTGRSLFNGEDLLKKSEAGDARHSRQPDIDDLPGPDDER